MVTKRFAAFALLCAAILFPNIVPAARANDLNLLVPNPEKEWDLTDDLPSYLKKLADFQKSQTIFLLMEMQKLRSICYDTHVFKDRRGIAVNKDELDRQSIALTRRNNPPTIWLGKAGTQTVIQFPENIDAAYHATMSNVTLEIEKKTILLNPIHIPPEGETLVVLLVDEQAIPLRLMPADSRHPADVAMKISRTNASGVTKIKRKGP